MACPLLLLTVNAANCSTRQQHHCTHIHKVLHNITMSRIHLDFNILFYYTL